MTANAVPGTAFGDVEGELNEGVARFCGIPFADRIDGAASWALVHALVKNNKRTYVVSGSFQEVAPFGRFFWKGARTGACNARFGACYPSVNGLLSICYAPVF